MKPVSVCILRRLFVVLAYLSLVSCGGAYSPAAPGAKQRQQLAALDSSLSAAVSTNDARIGYVFSENLFRYQPPICPPPDPGPCPDKIPYRVGNPVHSYEIDTVSGMASLSPAAIQVESHPVNTRSIAVSPSDRFLYMLTGDNLVYTFSIGYSLFTAAEFREQNLDPADLRNALVKAGYMSGAAASAEEIVNQLNGLLEQTDLFAGLNANNANVQLTAEITKLNAASKNSQSVPFTDLAESEQKAIVRLNRLMIELIYPGKTPANKGARAQHRVGLPLAVPTGSPDWLYNSNWSIEIEPLGRFVYVLGTGLTVYFRDPATGQLALSATQPYPLPRAQPLSPGKTPMGGIGQILFAPSGLFAYGSSNGKLQSYSIDRNTGLLTEIGDPFDFTAWETSDFNSPPPKSPYEATYQPPFHNIAADPTGKFLYLIGSAGSNWNPPPLVPCPEVETFHQTGSLIYTFFVDTNSGLLTQAGPPVDTTPHVMSAISVDAKGRFVQLLNTHEYFEKFPPTTFTTPSTCVPGSDTTALQTGAIYSYNIDQASGKLNPSGSVQAGGAQLPAGFVAAGQVSLHLTGDTTGRFLYLQNNADMYVYSVDQANGALTAIGSPLTGATATAMPQTYTTPVTWPPICYTSNVLRVCGVNGVTDRCCSLAGSLTKSLTWAGY